MKMRTCTLKQAKNAMDRGLRSLAVICLLLVAPYSTGIAQIDWTSPVASLDLAELPSTYVKKVIQDEYGFTWIVSYTGVTRYDGEHTFTLSDSLLPTQTFQDIIYDQKRKLVWIAAFDGVFSYDVISGKLKQHGSPDDKVTNQTTCIALDHHDRLWVGGRNGLGYIDLKDQSLVSIDLLKSDDRVKQSTIHAITTEGPSSNVVWLGTSSGLIKYDSSSGESRDISSSVDSHVFGIHDIHYDSTSQSLYLGLTRSKRNSHRAKVVLFDTHERRPSTTLIAGSDWESRQILSLNDSILLFSNNSQIAAYHKHSKTIDYNFKEDPNVGANKLEYIDADQRIWISSESQLQAFTHNQNNAQSYFYDSAHPGWIHVASDIYVDDDGRHIHLTEYGGEGLLTFDLEASDWSISPLLDSEGNIKNIKLANAGRLADHSLATIGESGLFVRKGDHLEPLKIELPSGRFTSQSLIDSNYIWSVDKVGLYRYDIHSKEFFDYSEVASSCKDIPGTTEIYRDHLSNIWIGGLCSNFYYYDQSEFRLAELNFPDPDFNSYVVSFMDYKNEIWAISHDLLIGKIDAEAPTQGIQTTIDIKALIDSDEIKFINTQPFVPLACTYGMLDNSGFLWLIIPKGLLRFDPRLLTLELFDKEDGLIVDDPDLRVFVADNLKLLMDGRMVYSTRKGITIFDPTTITKKGSKVTPYIRSLRINDQYIERDSSTIFKKSYSLKPTENFIGIDFGTIGYLTEDRAYRFRLNGLDQQWRDPEDRRHVYYTNLAGGSYQFELQISESSGDWTQKPLNLNIHIAEFWYKTIWAKGLVAVTVGFIFLGFYYSKLRRAIEKEQIKTQYEKTLAELKMQALTAQMNPHFIFNSLNSIDYYIIKNDRKSASAYLNRFSRLMRLILKNSRSNYISLREDLEALRLYLEIEALRFNQKFEFKIKVDEQVDIDYTKIPPMLVQPYVENAIWHGLLHKRESGQITIQFSFDNETELLTCVIRDNGIGRKKSLEMKSSNDKEKRRKSFGMNITKDKISIINRIHGIDANVEVTDLYSPEGEAQGTQVKLTIPI